MCTFFSYIVFTCLVLDISSCMRCIGRLISIMCLMYSSDVTKNSMVPAEKCIICWNIYLKIMLIIEFVVFGGGFILDLYLGPSLKACTGSRLQHNRMHALLLRTSAVIKRENFFRWMKSWILLNQLNSDYNLLSAKAVNVNKTRAK
jgi:hypothetical protein